MSSSDVISDMRVNVLEENSEKVVWYKVRDTSAYFVTVKHLISRKERFLSDDEIVDHLVVRL